MAALRPGAIALCAALALCAACSEIGSPAGEPGPPDGGPASDASAGADATPSPVTLVFGETPAADVTGVTADTYLDGANPTLNYGGDVIARVDADPARVVLLRFDIAAIPAGATIDAADLALTTAADALEQGAIQLYEVTEDWAEGEAVGAAAPANWTQRTAATDWTSAGAGSGSRTTTAMTELAPVAAATRYTTAVPIDLVQRWVDGAADNRGLVLIPIDAATHGVDFETSESATAAARPTLTITFTP